MTSSQTKSLTSPEITDISWQILQQNDQLLPLRALDSHKGDHGHVQVIGGDYGYAGAALMASEAALASGTGLVSCATRPEHISAYISRCPEIMAFGVNSGLELLPLIQASHDSMKVLVVGPGLGKQAYGQLLLQTILQQIEQAENSVPMVLDADGLNLLAAKPKITGSEIDFSNHNVIITPHPAEAARLLNTTVADVQSDRIAAITALVDKYACTVILKGQYSLVAGNVQNQKNQQAELKIYRCLDGNPAMASGGMGDILSGITGAILAQFIPLGLSSFAAAKLACCVHSKAADNAAETEGEIGLLATGLLPYIRRVIQVPLAVEELAEKALEGSELEDSGLEALKLKGLEKNQND